VNVYDSHLLNFGSIPNYCDVPIDPFVLEGVSYVLMNTVLSLLPPPFIPLLPQCPVVICWYYTITCPVHQRCPALGAHVAEAVAVSATYALRCHVQGQ
jgi:hypothetical protein